MKLTKKTTAKRILQSVLILSFLGGLLLTGSFFHLLPLPNLNQGPKNITDNSFGWKFPTAKFPSTGTNNNLMAYSDIRDPGGIPQGLPIRLKIPSIGVDTAIEDARITSDGRMDVPAGSKNVAWFALGPHPGQTGSAVIGGHFGIKDSIPFVFYNLDKLRAGDKIYIEDDKNDTLAFVVVSTASFDRNADATTVFTSSDGLSHLNLITCEGIWNQTNDSYPDRLVVFTNAIPSEGSVSVNPLLPLAGPMLTPTLEPSSTLPTPTPQPIIALPSSQEELDTSFQTLIQSLATLYSTPLDALITSFLLLSIAFVLFKIIRR